MSAFARRAGACYASAMRKKLYLAGPINGKTDAEVFDWRRQATAALSPHFQVVDPAARDFRGLESTSVREIVEGDLRDISECDVFFAYAWTPSVGTSMELRHAWVKDGRSTIVVAPENCSPWLRYHAAHLAHDLDSGIRAALCLA